MSPSVKVLTNQATVDSALAQKVSARRRVHYSAAATACFFGLIALTLFLAGIGRPAQAYYDEGYYIPAARALLADTPGPNNGSPPLGKLLIAQGIRVLGDNPLGWRVPGAIFGSLALVAVFLWAFLLTRDVSAAAIAACLTLFNNFLFVMSRIAMLDVFLVCFIFWGLVAYTAALGLEISATKRKILLYCAGILLGFAIAVKLNGVDALAVLLLVSCALVWLSARPGVTSKASLFRYGQNLRQAGIFHLVLALVIAPILSFSITFWPLCRSLHVAFNLRQLTGMVLYLWRFKVTTGVNMVIASKWYTWPVHFAPQRALSYLLGNPVVMLGGIAALIFSLRRIWKSWALPEALVVVLYAAYLLQWAVTPVKATFYYYYFPSAMFLGVGMALVLRNLPRTLFGVRVSLLVLIAAGIVFLWCLPHMAHLQAPWDCLLGCWG